MSPVIVTSKVWIHTTKEIRIISNKCLQLPITNDTCIQTKNDSCVETPCSSASSSVYHHLNNNNDVSSIFSSKPLPSKNFPFGIDWKSAPSVHHYHGKVSYLNNCTNVVVNCKTQPYRKRVRIIYSCDEEEEEAD